MKDVVPRPVVSDYQDPVKFVQAMLSFRKATEPQFSVLRSTKSLRKVSPALVSLILSGKRRITLDRAEELSKLLNLSSAEKFYFKNWIENSDTPEVVEQLQSQKPIIRRKEAGIGLLNDWLNVYVKDLFQLPAIQKTPSLIYEKLAHVANRKRVDRSFQFLLREGYLRRSLDGSIVIETNLSVADPKVPRRNIRNFHKAALKLARLGMDLFSPTERLATTVSIALNENRHQELLVLIEEFSEKLKEFAERDNLPDEPPVQLYQFIINLCPTGGKTK